MKRWFRLMLSENGEPSSKRCAGFFVIFVVMGCTIAMVIEHYDGVRELLELEFVSGCSLIGLSTVANIFQKGPAPTGSPDDYEPRGSSRRACRDMDDNQMIDSDESYGG